MSFLLCPATVSCLDDIWIAPDLKDPERDEESPADDAERGSEKGRRQGHLGWEHLEQGGDGRDDTKEEKAIVGHDLDLELKGMRVGMGWGGGGGG